jgi:hypothetical protein
MTDVYISYAREDRERIRPLAEMLQFEGWDVWWDPSEPTIDGSAALDAKLGSAGAILVVWSSYSRASEYVRSEAATGLYKNKLIQARIDSAAPPRPFDQVEVIDVNHWSGERDDPHWRRILAAVRLYAGEPGVARPQVTRRSPLGVSSAAPYLESNRSIAWGPIVAAAAIAVAGAGVWFADPFKWRSGGSAPTAMEAVATSEAASKVPAPAVETTATSRIPCAPSLRTSRRPPARKPPARCCACSMRRPGSTPSHRTTSRPIQRISSSSRAMPLFPVPWRPMRANV